MKTFYYCPGSRKIKGKWMTPMARFRLWRRRRRQPDLVNILRGW